MKSPFFNVILRKKVKATKLFKNSAPFRSCQGKTTGHGTDLLSVQLLTFLLGPLLSYAAELSASWQHQ